MPPIHRTPADTIANLRAEQNLAANRAQIELMRIHFGQDSQVLQTIDEVLGSGDAVAIADLESKLSQRLHGSRAQGLVRALESSPAGGGEVKEVSPASDPGPIPPEHRSRELTKAEAARLYNGSSVGNATDFFQKRPHIRIEGSGQRWFFDCTQFPDSAQEKLRG